MCKEINHEEIRKWIFERYQQHQRQITTCVSETDQRGMMEELEELCYVMNCALMELSSDHMTSPSDHSTVH